MHVSANSRLNHHDSHFISEADGRLSNIINAEDVRGRGMYRSVGGEIEGRKR